MTDWRAAWKLARFSWRRDWLGMLITCLFGVYVGWWMGVSLDELFNIEGKIPVFDAMVDWMYLAMFPGFGVLMNRTAMGIGREDAYTKRIAHWRTMPIALEVIVKARYMTALLLVPVIGFIFLMIQYGVSGTVNERFKLLEWLAFGLIWMCYALAVNALHVWMELGMSGKQYIAYYWCFAAACAIVSAGMALMDISLLRLTANQVLAGRYAWIPLSLVLAAAALYAGYRLTLVRMRNRSYVF